MGDNTALSAPTASKISVFSSTVSSNARQNYPFPRLVCLTNGLKDCIIQESMSEV